MARTTSRITSGITIGISAALFGKEGTPCFDKALLAQLSDHPDIEMVIMEADKTHILAEDAERFDAVYLMLERVTGDAIDTPARKLKLIARHGVGFDTVDIPGVSRLGIIVTNTPAAVRRPVASMAMTMLLSLSHRLIEKHNLTRAGRWADSPDFMGMGLTAKVLGVLGAGSIGSEILRLAAPFDMQLMACDPHVGEGELAALNTQKVDAETLFSSADYLIIATALTEDTHHYVDAGRLGLMKPDASVINVARGPVIKESDLIAALRAGRLRAAALDVFETEPVERDNPLLAMDNVITTAHSLCWTDECFDNIARDGLGSILSFVAGERPRYVVNTDVTGWWA
ncbi:MAG: 2-hydroxyacid dehydrogenase [Candidatus Puniceispirillaceae bacterium]